MRVVFPSGDQRAFLNRIIESVSAVSLRGLLSFGIDSHYSSLKNYYTEERTLPHTLFEQLLAISQLKKSDFSFTLESDSWGQVKGGHVGRRRKS